MSIVIMTVALLTMIINNLFVSMPHWIVRAIGIVIVTDLVVLAYSTVRIKNKDICIKSKGGF